MSTGALAIRAVCTRLLVVNAVCDARAHCVDTSLFTLLHCGGTSIRILFPFDAMAGTLHEISHLCLHASINATKTVVLVRCRQGEKDDGRTCAMLLVVHEGVVQALCKQQQWSDSLPARYWKIVTHTRFPGWDAHISVYPL